jgi:hypothetical protein
MGSTESYPPVASHILRAAPIKHFDADVLNNETSARTMARAQQNQQDTADTPSRGEIFSGRGAAAPPHPVHPVKQNLTQQHPTPAYPRFPRKRWRPVRLHSAIGYITPADKLAGKETHIFSQRDKKLEHARENRRQMRQAHHVSNCAIITGNVMSSSPSGKVLMNSSSLHFTLN